MKDDGNRRWCRGGAYMIILPPHCFIPLHGLLSPLVHRQTDTHTIHTRGRRKIINEPSNLKLHSSRTKWNICWATCGSLRTMIFSKYCKRDYCRQLSAPSMPSYCKLSRYLPWCWTWIFQCCFACSCATVSTVFYYKTTDLVQHCFLLLHIQYCIHKRNTY